MLISETYKRIQKKAHETAPKWGTSKGPWHEQIFSFIFKNRPDVLLDYGSGKGRLEALIKHRFTPPRVAKYDPCVEEFAEPPEMCDYVVCMDVVEHVERDCLDNVLADLSRVTRKAALISTASTPAGMILPDGTNAHKIQKPAGWWEARLKRHFQGVELVGINEKETKFLFIAANE